MTSRAALPVEAPSGADAPARGGPRLRPRVSSRRAFGAVAAFGATFVAGALAGGTLVDRCPLELRAPEAEVILRAARAMPRRPDVAAFGSSRFGGSVDPARVASRLDEAGVPGALVLNASLPAGDPISFDALLARLVAEGRAPRVAVVEVSPETVARASRWLKGDLLRFLSWREVVGLDPRDAVRARAAMTVVASRLNPFFTHRAELVAWLAPAAVPEPQAAPRATPEDGSPSPPAPRAATPREKSEAGRLWLGKWLRGYAPGGLPGEALERFLSRCGAAGIEVVLVGVPVSSPHRLAYGPGVDAAYRRFVDGLVRASGTRYVERRDLLPDAAFVDGHHVGPEGAARFSDHLASLLVSLRLVSAGAPR